MSTPTHVQENTRQHGQCYLQKILDITLAPGIIEMIPDGRQPADLTMAVLMKPFPVE